MSTSNSFGGVDQNSSARRVSFNDVDLEALVELSEGRGEEDHGEIELARLEDSRGSLMHMTGHEQPLDLLLMLHRKSHDTLPLSSTMTHESAGAPDNPDWLNASSIRMMGNSRDSFGISERLNNADLCLEASTASDVSALSVSSASASLPAPALPASPPVSVGAPPHSAASSVASLPDAAASSVDSEGQGESESDSDVDSIGPESSPRLRVRAGPADELMPQLPEDPQQCPAAAAQLPQQHQQQQQALDLLQVCRLTLDVLSKGGLLREDARRWLTPELLCDKICDQLHRPQLPVSAATGHLLFAESSASDADGGCELEFESPVGRVRQWLQAAGGGGGGGDDAPDESPSCLLHRVTNTV